MNASFEHRKGSLITAIALVLAAAVIAGSAVCYFSLERNGAGFLLSLVILAVVPGAAYLLYRQLIFPYYRRLEDANLELHLRQEELLDIKDDLFIKFLGVYDVNYAANSPRLFSNRMKDVADVTARVMEAEVCLLFLYDKKADELVLSAANKDLMDGLKNVRVALGEGIEGWVGRKLEPVMLKDLRSDGRFREIPELNLSRYQSAYCLPLYVYSNGALMGVMEVLYTKPRSFTDEEINFFTTLSGIIATTVQNEQMQIELRKMNLELEQWVTEKTEELRSSEERYRSLVENACDTIFVVAENGDVVFVNEQAASLTGCTKYDLVHKNFFELFVDSAGLRKLLAEAAQGGRGLSHADLRKADGGIVPVDVSAVGLTLMGKRFVQSVVRDMSSLLQLENLLKEKQKEIAELKAGRRP